MASLTVKKKGDTVEGFRILDEIGRGAASIIYLVQDPKSKQIWALKHVMKLGPKDQRFLDQAIAEYKIASQVGHPAIRSIDKVIKKGGPLNTKELFLVMELVDGHALDSYHIETMGEAVEFFRQVAEGIHAMHAAGYVHADMKPHNIIVGADFDGNPTAKVIDLGQSCKIGTIKERIQGPPDYIAPEQLHRREITPVPDVYNLGATMYWVFTRQHIPTAMGHNADSLVGSLDDALIEKATPAIELNPNLHPRLSALIMHAVEVDPNKRPQSMREVADQLDLIGGIVRAQAAPADAAFDDDDAD